MSSASPVPSNGTPGSQTPSKPFGPKVQHGFEGDVRILNGTFDSRMEIRKALQHLQQSLQETEGQPVQIAADVKFRISGPEAREHTYSVTVNTNTFDTDTFIRQAEAVRNDHSKATAAIAGPSNGHRPPSRSGSMAALDDDDLDEVRPFKKARTEADNEEIYKSRTEDRDVLLREALTILKRRSSDDALGFANQWHSEWVKQGGWLFDMLNKAEKVTKDNHIATLNRVASSQDVLGQSLNAASASVMAELATISKLIPWLEQCRKVAAENYQAREEKWRTSSATFHDQVRRDREAAEKKIEDELRNQRVLLVKVAMANGVDIGEDEKINDEADDKEASLGAQLTTELSMEASRAENVMKLQRTPQETIGTDDDGGQ